MVAIGERPLRRQRQAQRAAEGGLQLHTLGVDAVVGGLDVERLHRAGAATITIFGRPLKVRKSRW